MGSVQSHTASSLVATPLLSLPLCCRRRYAREIETDHRSSAQMTKLRETLKKEATAYKVHAPLTPRALPASAVFGLAW